LSLFFKLNFLGYIDRAAQRPAVEPIGRLCRTRFQYISETPKNIPTKTPAEGQFGSNRWLGGEIIAFQKL